MGWILQTERLALREMDDGDYPALCRILQDERAMVAYEGAFDDAMARNWLAQQKKRYREYGFGLWGVLLRESGDLIGQCGVTWQDYCGKRVLEIGYLFAVNYWHCGYATEAAAACRDYAFERLQAQEVYSIIRDNNLPSQRVARRNGMAQRGCFTKHYRGVDMPHLVFSISRQEWQHLDKKGRTPCAFGKAAPFGGLSK